MASRLLDAHIAGQARLRALVARAVGQVWDGLPGYDRADLDAWLAAVLPVVQAGQLQAATLAEAYLSAQLAIPAVGVDRDLVTGAAVRAGTPPADVYTRPLVTVWGALANAVPWDQAVAKGRARAVTAAETDLQLTHRATLGEVQRAEPAIRGWRRVADPGACTFCATVDGAVVRSADAAPLHPGCGCGFEPLLDDRTPTPAPASVAVHEHGELGPTLADPAHDFTGPQAIE